MRDRIRGPVAYASTPDMNEALQRARNAMDNPTRVLLTAIGTALCAIEPTLPMREVTRLAYAGRAAADVHGFGTVRTAAAVSLLLRHMPRVDWPVTPDPITRAEYGMRLLKAADATTTRSV